VDEAPARRADWYADPLGRHALRFWDGTRWTERVSSGGRLGTDAVDAELAEFLAIRGGDPRARWPGWVAAVSVVVGLVAIVAAGAVARLADGDGGGPLGSLAAGALTLYLSLLACCWAVRRALGGTSRGMAFDFGFTFRPGDLAWGLVASLAARLGAVAVLLPLALADEDFVAPDAQGVEGIDPHVAVLVAFTIVALVAAPVVEELFFRGLLQRALENVVPVGLAIATGSVLFGFAHFSLAAGQANVGVVVATGIGGAVFGVTAHVTRRIGLAVVGHAYFNLIPVLVVWTQ